MAPPLVVAGVSIVAFMGFAYMWLRSPGNPSSVDRKTLDDYETLRICRRTYVTIEGVREGNYYRFRNACANGYIRTAKYLVSLGLTMAEIRSECNVALQLACARGHLDVAEWLVGLGLTSDDVREAAMFEHPCAAWWPCGHQATLVWDSRGHAPRKVVYPAEVMEWLSSWHSGDN